jgi:hypothetical protein
MHTTDPPPGWSAEEFARYREYMGDNWLPPPELRHNGPPTAEPQEVAEDPNSKLPWHRPTMREHTVQEALAEELIDQADADLAAGLAQIKADYTSGTNGKPPAERAPIGDNNGPPLEPPSDLGPDQSYRIGFDIPEWVPRDQVREFESVLQAQGSYPARLAALDQAAFRTRASTSVSHRCFRLYDAILDVSKGAHRCSFLDLEKLGYVAGIDGSNASRIIHDLEEPGLVKALRFTEGRIGTTKSQKVLLAPIVTAEDRTKATAERIFAEAEAAKRAEMEKRAEAERRRYRERNPQSDRHGNGQKEDPVVSATVRNSDSHGNGQARFSDRSGDFSDRNGDFSDRRGDCLLNHIDNKPQEENNKNTVSSMQPQLTLEGGAGVSSASADVRGDRFDEFWTAFPPGRKKGKGETNQLFRKIIAGKHTHKATAQQLIDAAKAYAATRPDQEYTPMPSTWLNQGRWMDDLDEAAPKKRSKYDGII